MIPRNAARLVPKSLRNKESVIARGFFEVLFRWSRVGCQNASKTRNYGTTPARHRRPPVPGLRFTDTRILSLVPQWRSNSSVAPAASSKAGLDTGALNMKARTEQAHDTYAFPATHLPASSSSTTPDIQTSSTRETKTTQNTEPLLSHGLRTIMRTLPSAVVVLTTTASVPLAQSNKSYSSTPQIKYKNSRGMTLSSFASLTLAPSPIVTFNIRSPSRTLNALIHCKHFLIHILDASPEGARIANLFTKGNGASSVGTDGTIFGDAVKKEIFSVETESMVFDKDDPRPIALPRLRGKGVGKVLKCELVGKLGNSGGKEVKDPSGLVVPKMGLFKVGDHVLVLGRVLEILDRDGEEYLEGGRYSLSYLDGKYRKVGEAISLEGAC